MYVRMYVCAVCTYVCLSCTYTYVLLNRHEVMGALEELKTITTHDDNLEKQYKESMYVRMCGGV